MNKTSTQYDTAITSCKDIFVKKMKDYGTAWRVLRTSSITDQIFIKAQRIRNIEDKGTQKINDDVKSEYIGTGLALAGIGITLMVALPPPWWPKMPP